MMNSPMHQGTVAVISMSSHARVCALVVPNSIEIRAKSAAARRDLQCDRHFLAGGDADGSGSEGSPFGVGHTQTHLRHAGRRGGVGGFARRWISGGGDLELDPDPRHSSAAAGASPAAAGGEEEKGKQGERVKISWKDFLFHDGFLFVSRTPIVAVHY